MSPAYSSRLFQEVQDHASQLALAENGYGPSHYGWFKPGWLEVWDGANVHKLHLQAVKSFKLETLIDRLSVLKPIGDPAEDLADAMAGA